MVTRHDRYLCELHLFSRCQLLAGWNNNDVQSVGGGLLVEGSQLLIYGSGRMGLPFDPTWTGGNSSMGLATLRRDGELFSLCVCTCHWSGF